MGRLEGAALSYFWSATIRSAGFQVDSSAASKASWRELIHWL
jgi:hypothetical protein